MDDDSMTSEPSTVLGRRRTHADGYATLFAAMCKYEDTRTLHAFTSSYFLWTNFQLSFVTSQYWSFWAIFNKSIYRVYHSKCVSFKMCWKLNIKFWCQHNTSCDPRPYNRKIARPFPSVLDLTKKAERCSDWNKICFLHKYAILALNFICRSAGVPVVTLSGFAKRFDYDPEIPFTSRDKPNHSWNAVFVEEDWRFVDCCWGAGREDEAGRWTPKFEEFWFLTDPDKFINDHYPCMSTDTKIITNWQLMKQPISLDEFNKTVRLEEVCKEWGIELSYTEPILIFRKEIHITLAASVLLRNVIATLETVDRVSMDEYTVVYRFDTLTFSIQCRPPSPGTYVLKIFGKRDGVQSERPKLLLRYNLKCTDCNNYVKSFPYVYTHAQTYQCTLHEPNSRELPSKSEVRIRLSSSHLRQVNVEDIPLECDENGTWEGVVMTPQAGETIVIFGSTSDELQGRFNSLYKFFIV